LKGALAEADLALKGLPTDKIVRRHKRDLLVSAAKQADELNLNKRRVGEILEALKEERYDTDLSIMRARLYRKLAKPVDAVTELNRVLVLEPGNLTALELRAKLYFQDLLEFEKAERDITAAIRLKGDPKYYRERLDIRRGLGRIDDAIADLSRLIELTPASPKELSLRGALLIKQGRTAEGFADLDRSLKIIESSYARGQRGMCLVGLGNYSQAVIDLSSAIARNSTPSSYFRARALAYNKLGRFAESQKDVLVILARSHDDSEAYLLERSNRLKRVR
ncbi:MAG: tetratricopeptide repeat protein, partial [Cyanobacteria bacterium]|nr:tetratricopeptide repeat protein [Cyanobacteriota bacterium]